MEFKVTIDNKEYIIKEGALLTFKKDKKKLYYY
jgi:hypothetical protein